MPWALVVIEWGRGFAGSCGGPFDGEKIPLMCCVRDDVADLLDVADWTTCCAF